MKVLFIISCLFGLWYLFEIFALLNGIKNKFSEGEGALLGKKSIFDVSGQVAVIAILLGVKRLPPGTPSGIRRHLFLARASGAISILGVTAVILVDIFVALQKSQGG